MFGIRPMRPAGHRWPGDGQRPPQRRERPGRDLASAFLDGAAARRDRGPGRVGADLDQRSRRSVDDVDDPRHHAADAAGTAAARGRGDPQPDAASGGARNPRRRHRARTRHPDPVPRRQHGIPGCRVRSHRGGLRRTGARNAPEDRAAIEDRFGTRDLFDESPKAVARSRSGLQRVTEILRATRSFLHPAGPAPTDAARTQGADLRSALHRQGARARHRPGPRAGPPDRHPGQWRPSFPGRRDRPRDRVQGHAADGLDQDTTRPPRVTAAARRRRSPAPPPAPRPARDASRSTHRDRGPGRRACGPHPRARRAPRP